MTKSLSETAKEVIRGYMESGKEYDRKELVAAIKENAERKEEMSDGVIAGAIKMLTASNEIVVVARGRYKKGIPGKDQNMQERVMLLLRKFKADLDKMCMVNALNLKESDLQFIRKLNEVSNSLEASIWELEDFENVSGAVEAPDTKEGITEIQEDTVKKESETPKEKSGEDKKEGGDKKGKRGVKAKEDTPIEAA